MSNRMSEQIHLFDFAPVETTAPSQESKPVLQGQEKAEVIDAAGTVRREHLDPYELGQCLTPGWAAELFVRDYEERYGFSKDEVVCEPSAGAGAILGAIPKNIRAFGVELDERLAEYARENTGRAVIVGDFRTVDLPENPTLLIGNPPFPLDVLDGFIERGYHLLPEGGRMALILPCYAFQTAKRVVRYAEQFSIEQRMIPRNIFRDLSIPLMTTVWTKGSERKLIGFAFYRETVDVHNVPKKFREILEGQGRSVWLRMITEAMRELGGTATNKDIYKKVIPKAPPSNNHPEEQIRKVLQKNFRSVREGVWAFPEEMAA